MPIPYPLTERLIQWLLVGLAALGISMSPAYKHTGELSKGMTATTTIATKGYNEAWYSQSKEKLLLLYCPIPTFPKTTCAGMILSTTNYKFVMKGITDYRKQGLYQYSCFFGDRAYWNRVIARDKYVRWR
jgi:hypothetical protein